MKYDSKERKMIGVIGWLKKRKERKILEEEGLDKRLKVICWFS